MTIWLIGFLASAAGLGYALVRATTPSPVPAAAEPDPPVLLPRDEWEHQALVQLRAHPDMTVLLLDRACPSGARELVHVLDHVHRHLPTAVLGRLDRTRIGVMTPIQMSEDSVDQLRAALATCPISGGATVATCQPGHVGSLLAAITEADRHHRRSRPSPSKCARGRAVAA